MDLRPLLSSPDHQNTNASIHMNSEPTPFKTLLARATPGEWRVGPYGGIYPTSPTGACIICADHSYGTKRTNGDNNEAYLSRLSPAVMAKVWQALEDAKCRIEFLEALTNIEDSTADKTKDKIAASLDALNGAPRT